MYADHGVHRAREFGVPVSEHSLEVGCWGRGAGLVTGEPEQARGPGKEPPLSKT